MNMRASTILGADRVSGPAPPIAGGKLEAALAWAAKGFRVFPLQPDSKLPLDLAWHIHATTDPVVIKSWWTDPVTKFERDHNIGFLTTDWITVDVDVKNGKPGLQTFFDLRMDFDTLTMQTPTGGYHLVYQGLPDRLVGGSPLGEGLDVRSHNGYVVAPGSTIDGKAYVVAMDLPVAPFPMHLRDRLKSPRKRAEPLPSDVELDTPELVEIAAQWLTNDAPVAVEGMNGDDTTYRVACRVRDFGISEGAALNLFLEKYNPRCEPPWAPDAARVKIENAYRYATGEIGAKSPAAAFSGIVQAEVLPIAALSRVPGGAAPLITDPKGQPLPVLANSLATLRTRPELDVFSYNEMTLQAVIERALPAPPLAGSDIDDTYPRPVRDEDVSRLQELLQRDGMHRIGQDLVHQTVYTRATERGYHPVRDYLRGLKWDSTPRLATWLTRYLGAEDSPYHDGIGRMFLTAMVARIYQPGCRADYMPVLEGPQGAFKSTACAILAGEWFSDSLPDVTDEKACAQHLRGCWVVEVAELAALRRAESERLKSFISRNTERYRPPYGRIEVVEPRQCVLLGTTNRAAYLRDETGGRRFWPVRVGVIDIEALSRDRDQLFAEAVSAYGAGAPWWPGSDFEAQYIRPEQEARFEEDSWDHLVAEFLVDKERVQISEVARGALSMASERIGTVEQRRIAAILRRHGWVAGKRDHSGRAYVRMGRDA